MTGRLARYLYFETGHFTVGNEQERPRQWYFILSKWEHIISFGVGFAYLHGQAVQSQSCVMS